MSGSIFVAQGVGFAKANACPIFCLPQVWINTYPSIVTPNTSFTVTGSVSPYNVQVSVGTAATCKEAPDIFSLAILSASGSVWTIDLTTQYTAFYIWAIVTLYSKSKAISCLVTDGTQECCPHPTSGDRSVEYRFKRRRYDDWDYNSFYYGGADAN
jgi:hypothetical protein